MVDLSMFETSHEHIIQKILIIMDCTLIIHVINDIYLNVKVHISIYNTLNRC